MNRVLLAPFVAVLLGAVTSGCGGAGPQGPGSRGAAALAPLADDVCSGSPATGPAGRWRHLKSAVIARLGPPRHRGEDLVATDGAASEAIGGEITYGLADKALEDEWVQVFACEGGAWAHLGDTLTDGEGRFRLDLSGDGRLPPGQRDLFVSVVGDRTGARFLALVVPAGTALAVSDIDGTLTTSENAFPESLVTGQAVAAQPGAAAALAILPRRGVPIVYLTARGRYFDPETRAWLQANGFPRGPLRTASSFVTLPGDETVEFKVGAMQALGLPVAVGIGNRATDVEAYEQVGVEPDRILMKLPEFQQELQPLLDAGRATGFHDYAELVPLFQGL